MNRFSIKDLENITGIKAHTIRIWEQRYGILQPKRTTTNIRFYDADDLRLALRIALLNNYGFKISRIHEMKPEEMTALIGKIADPTFKLQHQVNELISRTLALDVYGFEEQVNTFIEKHGLEFTVEKLLFQYLEKVGVMWMMDRIAPAQEHMAANIIFRKIAVAADMIKPSTKKGKQVLLYLPAGEIHDLSLMYVFYLLRKAQQCPIYLGGNMPLEEIETFVSHHNPPYLYTHLTSLSNPNQVIRYLHKLSSALPAGTTAFVSGAILSITDLPELPNIRYLNNLTETRDVITAL